MGRHILAYLTPGNLTLSDLTLGNSIMGNHNLDDITLATLTLARCHARFWAGAFPAAPVPSPTSAARG